MKKYRVGVTVTFLPRTEYWFVEADNEKEAEIIAKQRALDYTYRSTPDPTDSEISSINEWTK